MEKVYNYTIKMHEGLMMKKVSIRDFATSFTTMMFLVIGISGVMMFFHFNDKYVKELHEILGLVFVGAAVLHIFSNWKAMKNYFSKKMFFSAVAVTILVSAGFVVNSLNKGDNPKGVMIGKVLNAPTQISFELLDGNYKNALKKLEAKGIKIDQANSISSIAKANDTSPFRIVSIISSK